MSLSHSPKVVTDGLVLYLDAANQRSYPKSGTTWSDLAGTNDGTLNNMENNFDPANKGSLSFDGGDDYIQINNAHTLINSLDITVCIWINQNSIHSDATFNNSINLFEIPSVARIGEASSFYLTLRNSTVTFRYQRTVNAAQLSPSASQEINIWRNYTGTSSSTGISLYKDGQFLGANSSTNSFAAFDVNKNGVRLGSTGLYGKYYNGQIGLFQMYNRALTGDEVRQNYLATRGRYK